MQVCTLLQTDKDASNPPLIFFTGRMLFLLPNQQRPLKQYPLREVWLYMSPCVPCYWHSPTGLPSTCNFVIGFSAHCLQCFDAVGWASGRAFGPKSDEVLVWLSVWSKVQIVCLWSCWCHCHPKTPSSLASFKSRLVLLFWYRLMQVVLKKRPLNGCSCNSVIWMQ